MDNAKPGLIMVFTGDGKGKTTAAVGQAIRALGHGFRVYMIHFMKGRDYGEFLATAQLPNLTMVRAGRDDFVNRDNPDPVDIELAQAGFAKARKAILSGEYDLVVLDEIHKDRRWKRNLKGVYDSLSSPCDILVTGSARLNVYKKGSDSLLGRFFNFRLHPFSFRELTNPSEESSHSCYEQECGKGCGEVQRPHEELSPYERDCHRIEDDGKTNYSNNLILCVTFDLSSKPKEYWSWCG